MITVRTTRSDNIRDQIVSIRQVLDAIENEGEDSIELDFQFYSFTPPLLSIFFAQLQSYTNVRFLRLRDDSYFNSIHFPDGMRVDSETDVPIIASYRRKNYLPIIQFNCSQDAASSSVRERVLTQINETIGRIAGLPTNYFSAISYFISELTDNIVSHSGVEYGWLSFQYYPTKNCIDLCIADNGKGILTAYQESGIETYADITTDIKAIQSAMAGNSIKNDRERGYGLHTSRNALVQGISGNFTIWTGTAILRDNTVYNIGTSFGGVLIHLRIPCGNISRDFNILNFAG